MNIQIALNKLQRKLGEEREVCAPASTHNPDVLSGWLTELDIEADIRSNKPIKHDSPTSNAANRRRIEHHYPPAIMKQAAKLICSDQWQRNARGNMEYKCAIPYDEPLIHGREDAYTMTLDAFRQIMAAYKYTQDQEISTALNEDQLEFLLVVFPDKDRKEDGSINIEISKQFDMEALRDAVRKDQHKYPSRGRSR